MLKYLDTTFPGLRAAIEVAKPAYVQASKLGSTTLQKKEIKQFIKQIISNPGVAVTFPAIGLIRQKKK